ncbi:metallophosphoesterase family protein [Tateyamaria sp.]|uniref:metallophosphoesterase family protein n=1 Tax=Tateyamaria sp. TaxID=1929288 RepID=UPI00329E3E8E
MQHQDIGELTGPVVLFGGPYSNLHATKAVLDRARILGATSVCTGDVVAYCARPVETIAAIRAAGCHVVAGNCEIQLAQGASDCGCGFEDGSACDILSVGWYGFANAQVDQGDRTWMGILPDVISFTHAGKRHAVIHGGVSDVARFLWSTSPDTSFEEEWDALESHIGPVATVWAGHCGIPFERDLKRGRWVNAGVVGMPPHDGKSQTRYAVLDKGQVQICVLDYNAAGARDDMRAAGLSSGYNTALTKGYWPSEDILPQDLRVSDLLRG